MPEARQQTCERCNAVFGCNLDGPCWCSSEPYRMPLPKPGESQYADCLCPACLREVAAASMPPAWPNIPLAFAAAFSLSAAGQGGWNAG